MKYLVPTTLGAPSPLVAKIGIKNDLTIIFDTAKTAAKWPTIIGFIFPRCQMKCLDKLDSMVPITFESLPPLVVKIYI